MEEEIVLLNELTGKVHKCNGHSLRQSFDICDCESMEIAKIRDKITYLEQIKIEDTIWEKADCLNEEEYEYNCPECDAHTCLVVSYTEDEVKGCSHCGYGKPDDALERMREMREKNEGVYQEMGEM